MTGPELLALSLGLSLAAAALGWVIMRALERRVADPILRERAWAAALYIPSLPPLVVGLMLLTPAPAQTAAPAVPVAPAPASVLIELQGAPEVLPAGFTHDAAVLALLLAGLLAIAGVASLGIRAARLRRLIRATNAAPPELDRTVEEAARRIGTTVPAVRVCGSGSEALLAGLRRPVLILPTALADRPDDPTTRAVCAHELAHLKRGDHRALWLEEALLAALAINPLLRKIRDHRAAAREEACDAAALAGSGNDARRLYARSLLEAVQSTGFRRTAPALTFTSARRTFVMHRLKAILAPASPAGTRSRRLALGLAAVIAGVAATGSLAVAAQRQPVIAEPPIAGDQPALTAASPRPEALVGPAPASTAAAVPAVASGPQPQPVVAEVAAEAAAPLPNAGGAQDSPLPGTITNPTWVQHPKPAFPAQAIENDVGTGQVTLSCTAEADGRLSGCSVVNEDPAGNGFGAAAVESIGSARLSPRSIDSAAAGATVRFTIRFRLPE